MRNVCGMQARIKNIYILMGLPEPQVRPCERIDLAHLFLIQNELGFRSQMKEYATFCLNCNSSYLKPNLDQTAYGIREINVHRYRASH